jgi:hypothetical protein
MQVRDLIEELQRCDPTADITWSGTYQLGFLFEGDATARIIPTPSMVVINIGQVESDD